MGLKEALGLSDAGMILFFIALIPAVILVIIAIFFIAGLTKKELDKTDSNGDSRWIGWIIGLLVAIGIIWAICTVGDDEPGYRHSYNLQKIEYLQNPCYA